MGTGLMAGFESTHWNGLQLLAWVYLRDRALVDEFGPSQPDRTIWDERNRGSGVLTPTSAPAPSSIRLDLLAAMRGHAFASREDAEDDILRHVRDGTLPVSAREGGQGPREIIPPLQLLDAELNFDKDQIITKDRVLRDWLLESAVALRLWPMEEEQQTAPPSPASSPFVNQSQQQPLPVLPASPVSRPDLREMLEKYKEKFEDEPELPDASVLKERREQLLRKFGLRPRLNGEPQFIMLVAYTWLLRTHKISKTDTKMKLYHDVLKALGQGPTHRGYSYDRFRDALSIFSQDP
jgi:hypothetical protein